jgi:capsular polysaccharide export protein
VRAPDLSTAAPGDTPARRPLYAYTGGFLRRRRGTGRVGRILTLAGYDIRLGLPGPDDLVGVWGRSPRAWRGEAMAARRGAAILRVEDAFVRSIHPGARAAPLGLLLDRRGVHFDGSKPSDLEHLLATAALDDTALLDRARLGMARMAALELSKYNAFNPALAPPPPGYVLVIDQVRGDAAVAPGDAARFRDMLVSARAAHPRAPVVIRAHPVGQGHLGPADIAAVEGDVRILTDPVIPARLFDGAVAVYTMSSLMGFEAVLTGHRPVVFGQPFYAGWGLTEDVAPPPRRTRRLTRPQLFAAAMILAPLWYDPCRDRLCSFEEALDQIEAELRAYRQDRRGHVATGMRLWKRGTLQRFFGREAPVVFVNDGARAARRAAALNRPLLVWAGRENAAHRAAPALIRVEDGFLRSRGLGAALEPPMSLVADDLGIYYDPSRESRLERLIADGPPPGGERRAEALIARICASGLSKYNLGNGSATPATTDPAGPRRILVPGQVEDDASIQLGCEVVRTNLALLQQVRAANPEAVLLYKPHPDVVARLRPGAVPPEALRELSAALIETLDAAAAVEHCDEVWTMTSTLGFETLLRGKPVTCLGMPFYAGWGLTHDLAGEGVMARARRQARPGLFALVHAVLIAYPRYLDPFSGLPCPPEVVVERLATGQIARRHSGLRLLSKAQGLVAGRAFWRG